MDKLERVLAAEETARSAISDALDRAAAIRAGAQVEARRIADTTAAQAVERAAAERDRVVGAAEAEAADITARAEADRARQVERAKGRMDGAVDLVVRTLRG